MAACDDTSYFFAGCLQDALSLKDDDFIMRLVSGRAEAMPFIFEYKKSHIPLLIYNVHNYFFFRLT